MDDEKKRTWIWLERLVKDEKKLRILIICGLALIALLFLGSLFPSDKSGKSSADVSETDTTTEEYRQKLEEQVLSLVNQIEGVGHAKVLLTLENGTETIYQSDSKRQSDKQTTSGENGSYTEDNQESVVIIEENGQKKALIKTERTPVVQGVVVVCDGAESVSVQSRVTQAVTTAFGISSARVAVVLHAQGS